MLQIRKAREGDFDGIWDIFRQVVATGDSYIYPSDTSKEQCHHYWMEGTEAYVADIEGAIAGTFVIRPNKVGRGSHVCNAGFMVAPAFQGQKIGRTMCEAALKEAKLLGYEAMQFNIVVSTNERAVKLWTSAGFKIIGTVPKAFNHATKGLVDIYIMHRFL